MFMMFVYLEEDWNTVISDIHIVSHLNFSGGRIF